MAITNFLTQSGELQNVVKRKRKRNKKESHIYQIESGEKSRLEAVPAIVAALQDHYLEMHVAPKGAPLQLFWLMC